MAQTNRTKKFVIFLFFPYFPTKMSEELSKAGLYFDDLHTLRVLEPNIATETNDLKDECNKYTESEYFLFGFQSIFI